MFEFFLKKRKHNMCLLINKGKFHKVLTMLTINFTFFLLLHIDLYLQK